MLNPVQAPSAHPRIPEREPNKPQSQLGVPP